MKPIEATNRAGQSTAVGRPKPVQSADQGPQQRLGFFAVRLRNRLYLGSNAFLFGPNHPANLEKGPGQRDTQAGLPSDPCRTLNTNFYENAPSSILDELGQEEKGRGARSRPSLPRGSNVA